MGVAMGAAANMGVINIMGAISNVTDGEVHIHIPSLCWNVLLLLLLFYTDISVAILGLQMVWLMLTGRALLVG